MSQLLIGRQHPSTFYTVMKRLQTLLGCLLLCGFLPTASADVVLFKASTLYQPRYYANLVTPAAQPVDLAAVRAQIPVASVFDNDSIAYDLDTGLVDIYPGQSPSTVLRMPEFAFYILPRDVAVARASDHVFRFTRYNGSALNEPGAYVYVATSARLAALPGTAANDSDGDGITDSADNCPYHSNANQLNSDTGGFGDACDTDDDNDGFADGIDAFPTDPAEYLDDDNDGVGNFGDNCPSISNPNQADSDDDGLGDLCDPFDGRGGDVTRDNQIDAGDLVVCMRIALGLLGYDSLCDVSPVPADGAVTAGDIVVITNRVLGP